MSNVPENLLTRKECFDFISRQLHLSLTDDQLNTPTVELLQQLCRAYVAEVPFSNLSLLATPVGDRKMAGPAEIKRRGLSKRGLRCYGMNVFFAWLLQGLGFRDVYFSLACFHSVHYTHTLLIVPIDRKRYLVDLGVIVMVSENVICLDFEGDVSPVYLESLWRYHYRYVSLERLVEFLPQSSLSYLESHVDSISTVLGYYIQGSKCLVVPL